jgi:hypothetical protein
MTGPSSAAASPITIAQPNSATSGRPKAGSPGMASENVPSPVALFRPTKISAPTPAASSPGTRIRPIVGPPETGRLHQGAAAALAV